MLNRKTIADLTRKGAVSASAGRLFSRRDARERFTVEEHSEEMTGIYTTSVNRGQYTSVQRR